MTGAAVTPRNAGVIAPPPLLFAGFLAAGLLIERFAVEATTGIGIVERFTAAGVLGGGGAALLIAAVAGFRTAGTRPEPWLASSAVVDAGPYRFSRNPMYLGMALIYLAIAAAADAPVALALFVPLVVVVHYGVIAREERYMAATFGNAYLAYKARVRRWL